MGKMLKRNILFPLLVKLYKEYALCSGQLGGKRTGLGIEGKSVATARDWPGASFLMHDIIKRLTDRLNIKVHHALRQ